MEGAITHEASRNNEWDPNHSQGTNDGNNSHVSGDMSIAEKDGKSANDSGAAGTQRKLSDNSTKSSPSRWRYAQKGHRMPRFASDIQSLHDSQSNHIGEGIISGMKRCEEVFSTLQELAEEEAYWKQQTDLYNQERDLLRWHRASNDKVLQLKRSELKSLVDEVEKLERKLKVIRIENVDLQNKRNSLIHHVDGVAADIQKLKEDFAELEEELDEWTSKRKLFEAETKIERRLSSSERKSRIKQARLLLLAVNRDKKTHTVLNTLKSMESVASETFEKLQQFLHDDIRKAASLGVSKNGKRRIETNSIQYEEF